ncbi:MAG: AMP-binding protein [Actinomycetaceae bacterium]|nr:AMP-binding protein [Actinomycetaceae bacterium]
MAHPELMLVPGGTSPAAVTMTYAAVHKLWEFFTREEKTGQKRGRWIIVAPRPPQECLPSVAERSNAALQGRIEHMPEGVDVIVETSGSTTGQPHLVGLSYRALVASARATHKALGGPGRWIVALPVNHIAGLQTLVRCCVAESSPIIADMSAGFDADALARACRTIIDGREREPALRGYLSLVPKQLADAVEVGGELVDLLAQLDAILVGGAHIPAAVHHDAVAAGLPVVTTYGMTETGGGCVYDGRALPGVDMRIRDGRIELSGPVLMEDYLDVKNGASFVEGGRWLRTGDTGVINGTLTVYGRADDVIISGGTNVSPAPIRHAIIDSGLAEYVEVVGLADQTWGQIVTAVIVSDQPAKNIGAAVREAVAQECGRQVAPRVVVTVDSLPTTELGKPARAAITELAVAERAAGRAWER